MTDIHNLSNAELNEAIAKKKGWSYSLHFGTPLWEHPETGVMVYHYAPDYTHNWNLAGGLLEEMPLETSLTNFEDELDGTIKWQCVVKNLTHPSKVKDIIAFADTPQRAICEVELERNETIGIK